MAIDQQSSKDLEFNLICELLSGYCKSIKAKDIALKLSFFDSPELLERELNLIEEIQLVYQDDGLSFPHPNAEDIDGALKMLRVENGVLTLDELIKVYDLCMGTKQLTEFSRKHKNEYPLVFDACAHIDRIHDVLKIITAIFDAKHLTIKNDATPRLFEIRTQLQSNRRAINKNFEQVLRKYRGEELLGETEETHLENRRLLTVLSQYKKQVKGRAHGISAKGTNTYIEPVENIELNARQDQLQIEDRHEIYTILEAITYKLRSEKNNLKAFQRLLIKFDLLNAKVLFASTYNGTKPIINRDKKMVWQNAKHPLLYIKNNSVNLDTIGQDIEMDDDSRFLVISGPNAGGKSITLKTIGLLQMMLQSGLFVSLNSGSSCTWFDQILSDIGDNQSIENQLSTYSYRLNRMQHFLGHVNTDTLLLLDEFGSGSDPELGGALAEVFYEELYQKGPYAVITTHYTNIKILTASLPQALNACMLFDTKKLQPLYQLSVGQPGSSFTFEVAQFNGISEELIAQAKVKVSESKLKIDGLTVALQQEKSKFKKINTEQYKSNAQARRQIQEYNRKLEKITEKSATQTQYFEQQNKFVNMGKKVFELIKKFKQHKTNKALFEAAKKLIAIEKTNLINQTKPLALNHKLKLPELPQIKKEVKIEGTPLEKVLKAKSKKVLKIGDSVKLKNHTKAGLIKEIKGKKITVEVGNFTISTRLEEIEN